ncbi:MAG: DNA helicase [Rickettsiales bacterium]|nr:MAG: DNA helicase [Rickettsiales bacterium]
MSSYFYLQANKNSRNASFLERLQLHAEDKKELIYVLNKPLTDQKYNYRYSDALIILSPKHKIAIIDCGVKDNDFDDYVEDVIEDVGSISDKYLYKEVIGRPRQWRQSLLVSSISLKDIKNEETLFQQLSINQESEIKKIDLLISLFIGSINDIDRVKEEVPMTTLDKVKQKIQLFDGDQTRFVYQNPEKKRITIQGLSGTGKTELLLHKLKDLYISDINSIIYFTCHNKILADNLKKRIPTFFNFMKVEQQIEWNTRLWCTNAWGSAASVNSGAYRHICAIYQIPFHRYSPQMSFSYACKLAINAIKDKFANEEVESAFTYMFVDESQDFDENFFTLCELVTERNVYIAGDIFQSIFDESFSKSIKPDFLLGKCYRTDPKTLMFAHALGMGLFERNKLRWLEEREWEDCGYNVEVRNKKYYLSREPLRRFEDLDDSFESIKIVEITDSYSETVIQIIDQIKSDNNTVLPEDIGIILLDLDNDVYALSDMIEIRIKQKYKWSVNKAYETKEKQHDAVFISNRNNVKGLEFPFVICITKAIKNTSSYRNSLYTMLTRSFIKSFLLIPSKGSGLTDGMKTGLREIVNNKQMVIQEPNEQEKIKIKTSFEYRLKKQSHYDLMMKVFKELKVDKKNHDKLFQAAQQFEMTESDIDTLRQFVKDSLKYIKDK